MRFLNKCLTVSTTKYSTNYIKGIQNLIIMQMLQRSIEKMVSCHNNELIQTNYLWLKLITFTYIYSDSIDYLCKLLDFVSIYCINFACKTVCILYWAN